MIILQYLTLLIVFIMLLIACLEDYKSYEIKSTTLFKLTLSVIAYIFIASHNKESSLIILMVFPLASVGIMVIFELLTTTFFQEYYSKVDTSYKDVVVIGEADYILIFTIAALLDNVTLLMLTYFIFSTSMIIYKVLIKKHMTIVAMFPAFTLSALVSYLCFIYFELEEIVVNEVFNIIII